jgi:parvulin-like peptidyl-prolyl isomerase
MFRFRSGLLAASLVLFTTTGCFSPPSAEVASVNGLKISEQEFNQAFQKMTTLLHLPADKAKDPKLAPLLSMFKKQTLDTLILQKLVASSAEKQGVQVTPQDIDHALKSQWTQFGGEQNFKLKVESAGLTLADVKDQLKEKVLQEKLVEKLGAGKLTATLAEARAYYDTHPKEFDQPEQVHARHILVAASPAEIRDQVIKLKGKLPEAELQKQVNTAVADKRQKAESIVADAVAHPEKFEALAQANSDDPGSAKSGGDLGYFSKDTMVPEFASAAFASKPGQIVPQVVQTQYGFHIISVLDHKTAGHQVFKQVEDQIVLMLENQRKQRIFNEWLLAEKAKAKIDIAKAYHFDASLVPSGSAAPKALPKKG